MHFFLEFEGPFFVLADREVAAENESTFIGLISTGRKFSVTAISLFDEIFGIYHVETL